MILSYTSTMAALKLSSLTTITKKRFLLRSPSAISDSRIKSSSSSSSNQYQRIVDTESLRTQLDQLHAEAESARSKANNARLRLMRLSESAENLQKRAAMTVLVGKESEARELLVQKKKLMNALEKSKQRIDVLDKLAAKINEAISLKEEQLIGNVAMYPEFTEEDSGGQIYFVNPRIHDHEDSNKSKFSVDGCIGTGQNEFQEMEKSEEILLSDIEELINASKIDILKDENVTSNLYGMSSFEEFLQYVDGKLQQVESDLLKFLRLSRLILEGDEKQPNTRVQQTSGILKDVRSMRMRIASIIKETEDDKNS